MDMITALKLMLPYPGTDKIRTPRRLIEVKKGGDWIEKPPAPPKPNAEDYYGEDGSRWTSEANDRFREAYWAYEDHHRYWPIVPKKIFRRMVKRGYIDQRGGTWGITPLGMKTLRNEMIHLSWWHNAKGRSYGRRRSTQPHRITRAYSYVKMWNGKGYGKVALRMAISRYNLTASDVTRLKAKFYYLTSPDEDEENPPPPRKSVRKSGWQQRIDQRNRDLKYKMIEG